MDERNKEATEVSRSEAARRRLMRAEEEYKTAVQEEMCGGLSAAVQSIDPDPANAAIAVGGRL